MVICWHVVQFVRTVYGRMLRRIVYMLISFMSLATRFKLISRSLYLYCGLAIVCTLFSTIARLMLRLTITMKCSSLYGRHTRHNTRWCGRHPSYCVAHNSISNIWINAMNNPCSGHFQVAWQRLQTRVARTAGISGRLLCTEHSLPLRTQRRSKKV